MKIRVRIFGALARPTGEDDFEHDLADGASVAELLASLGYAPTHVRSIQAAVNGEHDRHSRPLRAGDEVSLFLPTQGG